MTARILDGLKIREQIFEEIKGDVARLAEHGMRPGLAAVLVGENPASQLYVKSKIAACEQLGLASWLHTPPATISTEQLLKLIRTSTPMTRWTASWCNCLCPRRWMRRACWRRWIPSKDVDGFHPVNLGKLVSNRPGLVACTPAGCMEILRRNKIPLEGANAVVLGRSDIVGKPMALLLMHANATVTICHSKTRDLPEVVRRADIVVAAMGKAGYVQADWIRPGATVIDVGTNRVTDAGRSGAAVAQFPGATGKIPRKGKCVGGRRASGRAADCGSADAGAGRRWTNDHRHADEQHGESGALAASSRNSACRQIKRFTAALDSVRRESWSLC